MIKNHDRVVIRGLKDVTAAETRISFVDPLGALYYSGFNIDDLIGRICYEEVVHLLLYNKLPNKNELDNFRAQLISEMRLPEEIRKSRNLTLRTKNLASPKTFFTCSEESLRTAKKKILSTVS